MMIMNVKAKRGRKKKPRLVRGLTRYLVMACIIFGTAFVCVKQRNSVTKLGYIINDLKKRIKQFDEGHDSLEIQLSELKRPDRIKKAIRDRGLRLSEVEPRQKVTLRKPDAIEIMEAESQKEDHEKSKKNDLKGESLAVRN